MFASVHGALGYPKLHFGLQTKKLEAEVLAPMQRWMTAYNTVQVCTLFQLSLTYQESGESLLVCALDERC